ncbi:MAG: hypothetical protein ACYC64_19870, partial [Armatimonadota bacterium]
TSQTINRVVIKNWTAIDGISVQVWNSDTSAFETVATGDLPWQDTATFGFQNKVTTVLRILGAASFLELEAYHAVAAQ